MRGLLILLMLFATPALAQTVTVKSGEHGDFTRLVLTFRNPVDWVLGRTDSGYALRIEGPDLRYDLSSVYRLITRDRLRSIWVDPETGDLLLGIDCPCHAIPFEFRANILVIDIKDGAPPPGSSFELNLTDSTAMPPIRSAQPQRPRRNMRRGEEYDWLARIPTPQVKSPGLPPIDTLPAGLDTGLRLEDFRSMLIDEVGRGATQGVVEMAPPPPPRAPVPEDPATNDPADSLPENARAAINALPGVEISADPASRPNLMVQGESCPATADLDVGTWSGSEDAVTELARARAAVLTEFDVPDPVRVIQAVDTYLHFGLGAEARLLLASFLSPGKSDPLRAGLSYLVDGDNPPVNPFRNMQSCDSAAALWALLAAPQDEALSFINGNAVSRAFLALPASLRANLGPETAKRLLASGDSANAEVVRMSFERAVPRNDPSLDMLAADQALQAGDPAGAEAALPTGASGTSGEMAMATLFGLIEARFQQRKAVEGKDILALEAFAFEHRNGPVGPRLDRALSHATALAGDFASAFAHAGENAALEQDIWMLLAEIGAESALLTFSVGLDPARRAGLPLTTRSRIAERLIAAGLPNAAADWAQSGDLDPDLVARVALANGDARSALRLLTSGMPDADPDLVASSYTALGDFNAAAWAQQSAGNRAEAARLQRWAGTWPAPDGVVEDASTAQPALSPENAPDDTWATLAGLLGPTDQLGEAPPLQAGQMRLEHSATTRQAIADLLASAPVP
ncbi:MAG: hypothetical protein ACK4HF_04785 [Paracoccaceae bacterium]